MKKIIAVLFIASGVMFHHAKAQVNVQVNIGAQPVWGPVGYDYVEYYYLPDIEAYYYVPSHQYVYLSNGRWIFAAGLPARFRTYNVYSGYKVVINEPRPYLHYKVHKIKYAHFKGNKQVIIRDSRDSRYYVVKGHPGYKNNGRGHGKGHGNGRKH